MKAPDAPRLASIPLFAELLEQRTLTRHAQCVYGAIAAYHALDHAPTVKQISMALYYAARGKRSRTVAAIAALERAGMIKRIVTAQRAQYVLFGPTVKR